MFKKLLLIIFLLFQFNLSLSEVYKWVDENGKTVYGDKPVSEEANIVEIKKTPKQDKKYQERIEKQKKLLNVMKEERADEISRLNKEKEEKEKQEKECSKLKKELKKMKDSTHLFEETDDPHNPKIYTDEERKAEEDKREKYIQENC